MRIGLTLVLVGLTASAFCSSAYCQESAQAADSSAPQIRLTKKFLGSPRFKLGESEPHKVYGFFGTSFSREFEGLMSEHPPSLKMARKAFPYNAVADGGAVALLVLTAKDLVSTINKASKVSKGELVDDSFKMGDLVLIGVTAAVTLTASLIGSSHVRKGVRSFNEQQKRGLGIRELPVIRSEPALASTSGSVSRGLGIHFGLNFAGASGKSAKKFKQSTRVVFGCSVLRHIKNWLALQPECLVSLKGYRSSSYYSGKHASYNLTDIEIPLLAKLIMSPSSKWSPNATIGPELTLNVGSSAEFEGRPMTMPDIARLFGFGIAIGAGMRVNDTPLSIGLRHTIGLSKIYKSSSLEMRHSVTSLFADWQL